VTAQRKRKRKKTQSLPFLTKKGHEQMAIKKTMKRRSRKGLKRMKSNGPEDLNREEGKG